MLVGRACAAAGTLFGVKVLTQTLSPPEYGEFSITLVTASLLGLIVFSPLAGTAVRRSHEKDAPRSLGLVLAVAATASLLLIAMSSMISPLEVGLVPVAVLLASVDGPRSIAVGVLNALRRRISASVLAVAEAWIRPSLAVLTYHLAGRGPVSALLGYLLAGATLTPAALLTLHRTGLIGRPERSLARTLLGYGSPFVGLAAASWVLSVSDRYALALFRNSAEVGLYVAGYQLGAFLPQAVGALYAAIEQPVILQAHGRGQDSETHLGAAIRNVTEVIIPVVVLSWLLRDDVIALFAPIGYRAAAEIIPWVAIGAGCLAIDMLANTAHLLSNRTAELMRISFISAAANVLLNVALVPTWGLHAAAATTAACYALQLALVVATGRRHVRWPLPTTTVARCLSAAAVAGSVASLVQAPAGLLHGFTTFVLFVAVYLLVYRLAAGHFPKPQ